MASTAHTPKRRTSTPAKTDDPAVEVTGGVGTTKKRGEKKADPVKKAVKSTYLSMTASALAKQVSISQNKDRPISYRSAMKGQSSMTGSASLKLKGISKKTAPKKADESMIVPEEIWTVPEEKVQMTMLEEKVQMTVLEDVSDRSLPTEDEDKADSGEVADLVEDDKFPSPPISVRLAAVARSLVALVGPTPSLGTSVANVSSVGDSTPSEGTSVAEVPSVSVSTVQDTIIQDLLRKINTGSKEQLMTLKGIGEKRAQSILNYREQSPFKSLQDLEDIGFFPKQIQNLVKAAGSSLFE